MSEQKLEHTQVKGVVKKKLVITILVTLVLLAIDQWTKSQALLFRWYSWEVLPFLSLHVVMNTGIAFGWLAGGQQWILVLLALVVMILVNWQFQFDKDSRYKLIPGAMFFCICVNAGALGNVIDRLQHGAVVDFLHLHFADTSLFVFNMADLFISLGVAYLVIEMLMRLIFKKQRS